LIIKLADFKKIIRENILFETKYKLFNLKEKNVIFNLINETFENINIKYSLYNQNSPGRFFIDVLYECINDISKFNESNIQYYIENICTSLLFLYQQKDVTSKKTTNGIIFKDYIYDFMLNYNKNNYEYSTNTYEKLLFVYQKIQEKSEISGLNRIIEEKNLLKKNKTFYPFNNNIIDGFLVVCPLNMASSIFWARTNWLAEDIVLNNKDDTKWCTARLDSNLFNTYFFSGDNIFYFLPENDISGHNKISLGLKKIITNSGEKIYCNKITSVITSNNTFYLNSKYGETEFEFNDNLKIEINKKTGISLNILNHLEKIMLNIQPIDKMKYFSLIDLNQFKTLTNFNTLAPINHNTGLRDETQIDYIRNIINELLNAYLSREYTSKYNVDLNILDYIEDNIEKWKKYGIFISKSTLENILNFY